MKTISVVPACQGEEPTGGLQTQTPAHPGVYFMGYRTMPRRYAFEIMLFLVLLCGGVALLFFL
ncbi:hypothetical protein DDT56_09540 [Brenneria corticis]|uniref:Uncharacterized protein n=1 Tax=Brenneria corticis TaxID=2173106 RepID=A0A2U1U3T3_9GAMM|nr:hypothetical protein DDT56_09540 [Brenneria sp. CFCC 11842]